MLHLCSRSLDRTHKNDPLPPDVLHAFKVLLQQLTSDPVMAFPHSDQQYVLITDATTGTAEFSGGLGAILTQVDDHGNHYAISFASRQLKDHEQNYSPFLLEAALPSGELRYSMSILEASNSSFLRTTSLWKIRTFTHQDAKLPANCSSGA